jgi:Tol biopolymer transport system component
MTLVTPTKAGKGTREGTLYYGDFFPLLNRDCSDLPLAAWQISLSHSTSFSITGFSRAKSSVIKDISSFHPGCEQQGFAMKATLSLAILLAIGITTARAQLPSYSKQIQPLFSKYCSECHNAKKPRAGLNLESIEGLRTGSDNGPVLVPGKADASLLVLTTERKKEPHMPPKDKPQPKGEEVALLRAWVNGGAIVDSAVAKVVLPAIPAKLKAAPPIGALAYHPDGKRLFAGSYQKVTILDPGSREVQGQQEGFSGKITALAVSPDGKYLAVTAGTPGTPAMIHLYAIPNAGQSWPTSTNIVKAHADIIQHLTFSPDGKILASASYDKQVKFWDPAGGKLLNTLTEHSDSVYGITFSPDGKLFASAAADRAVKVWQTAGTKLLYTLGESTDWVYAIAWSPDGKHLAAAGVDKSIRVWKADAKQGDVVQSVFAHLAPVVQLVYSKDGKTLYSIGEDGSAKSWDAKSMVEKQVYANQPETILSLALSPNQKQLVLGRFDGHIVFLDPDTGKEQGKVSPDQLADVREVEPNDSPGRGQNIRLPATLTGTLGKAGDVDYFRFEVQAGQELGVKVDVIKGKNKEILEPLLQLTDAGGQVLLQSVEGFLGYKFAKTGTYSLGILDRDYRGNADMKYRLHLGDIPIVTSIFPLGLQKGSEAKIHISGVHLGDQSTVSVKADTSAAIGSKLPVKVATPNGTPLGARNVVVGEFPEVMELADSSMSIPVPGTANGQISRPGETDTWRFTAKKGQTLILEVNARRLGSELDSYIEILDASGQPVARATLRSLAQTYVAFRDHNSVQGNIRIETWTELAVNDYILVGTDLMKIRALPTHPDADCNYVTVKGKRVGFFDTTPTYHTKGEPMYKVAIHPPGTEFPPNGFPVITLFYRNDDGGADYGRDSRLTFEVPADGDYQVRIGDSRNQGGDNHSYRLTIRFPRPNYTVRFAPTEPKVWKGGAVPITVTADRFDGFAGPIDIKLENLPAGFDAPATTIPANENETTFALWANADAKDPDKKAPPLKLTALAMIDGKSVEKTATGGIPKAMAPGDLVTRTNLSEVTITPGGKSKLVVSIQRGKGFKERVPIDVQGLPHGVKVLDIGLNGILITENETQRTMVLYCEPWVQPMDHPIVVTARRESPNTQYSARSVLLKIVGKK